MPSGYIPIFIFLAIAIAFPVVTIIVAKLIRPSSPFATKLEAYECGIKAASDSRGRYTVRFYIIAILFVIFDVETIFLFPWAVRYKSLGWFGVAEVVVFLAILVVGVALVVTALSNRGAGKPRKDVEREPLDILAERYARGEIDREDFEERRRTLGS